MSYGIFEAAATDNHDQEQHQRAAGKALEAAIFDARQQYGGFLSAAVNHQDFEDRLALTKPDMMKTVAAHLDPVTGVMNKVVKACKPDLRATARLNKVAGGDFTAWSDDQLSQVTTSLNEAFAQGAPVPSEGTEEYQTLAALSAELQARGITAKKAFEAKTAHFPRVAKRKKAESEPDRSELIPKDDFDGYLDSVDEDAENKVEVNFTSGLDDNRKTADWDDPSEEAKAAIGAYYHWATGKGLDPYNGDNLDTYGDEVNLSIEDFDDVSDALDAEWDFTHFAKRKQATGHSPEELEAMKEWAHGLGLVSNSKLESISAEEIIALIKQEYPGGLIGWRDDDVTAADSFDHEWADQQMGPIVSKDKKTAAGYDDDDDYFAAIAAVDGATTASLREALVNPEFQELVDEMGESLDALEERMAEIAWNALGSNPNRSPEERARMAIDIARDN